jgi:hypothetical protein
MNIKTYALGLMATGLLFLSSCDNDDSISLDNLVGKWEWEGGSENGKPITLSDCQQLNTIEYKTDNRVVFTEYFGSACLQVSVATSTYIFKNGTIEHVYSSETEVATILELNSEHLKIKWNEYGTLHTMEYRKIN